MIDCGGAARHKDLFSGLRGTPLRCKVGRFLTPLSSMARSTGYERHINGKFKQGLLKHRNLIVSILGCQILSMLLCGTAVFSKLLVDRFDTALPTGQSVFVYCLLLATTLPIFVYRFNVEADALSSWTRRYIFLYSILAVLEVEANFMAVKAYQYTSVVSVQILDCLTLPIVFLLSTIFLKRRHHVIHYIGLVVTLAGSATIIAVDHLQSKQNGNSTQGGSLTSKSAIIGDVLMAGAACIYGILNVMQEKLLRTRSSIEYLFSFSLWASVVATCQALTLEKESIQALDYTNADLMLCLCGYVLVLYLFYMMIPWQMKKSGCVLFNMNLQTSDVYTMLFGTLLFKDRFSAWYIVAWCSIVIGTLVYVSKPTKEYDDDAVIS